MQVVRDFDLPADLALPVREKPKQIRLELEVNKGLIAEVHVKVPMSLIEGELGILNLSFLAFEKLTEKMEEKTKRTAWFKFIERTIFHYRFGGKIRSWLLN